MKDVKINKRELLDQLLANRSRHRQIFEEAVDGYKRKVVEELERMLYRARKGDRVAERVHIPQPVDQTREYDRVIRMLEMSVDDTVTLTAPEFECYVMDRWHWRQQFLASNALYSKMAEDTMVADDSGTE